MIAWTNKKLERGTWTTTDASQRWQSSSRPLNELTRFQWINQWNSRLDWPIRQKSSLLRPPAFFRIVLTLICPRCFNFSCPCSQFKNYSQKCINLTPNVDCNNVAIPDTKNIVLRISLMTSLLPWKHMGICKMKGIANVDPSMVRKCWKY